MGTYIPHYLIKYFNKSSLNDSLILITYLQSLVHFAKCFQSCYQNQQIFNANSSIAVPTDDICIAINAEVYSIE